MYVWKSQCIWLRLHNTFRGWFLSIFFDYTKGPKSLQSRRHIYQYVDNLFCRAETGFRHVEAVKYTPRLIHVSGDKVKGYSVLRMIVLENCLFFKCRVQMSFLRLYWFWIFYGTTQLTITFFPCRTMLASRKWSWQKNTWMTMMSSWLTWDWRFIRYSESTHSVCMRLSF